MPPVERGRGLAGFGDAEIEGLEAADLVAQPRRLLEFEIGRGLAHLLLQIGDGRLQIVAQQMWISPATPVSTVTRSRS